MKKQCSVGDDVVFEINLKSWRSPDISYLGYQTKEDCLTNLIPMIFSNLAKLFLSFFFTMESIPVKLLRVPDHFLAPSFNLPVELKAWHSLWEISKISKTK